MLNEYWRGWVINYQAFYIEHCTMNTRTIEWSTIMRFVVSTAQRILALLSDRPSRILSWVLRNEYWRCLLIDYHAFYSEHCGSVIDYHVFCSEYCAMNSGAVEWSTIIGFLLSQRGKRSASNSYSDFYAFNGRKGGFLSWQRKAW